MILKKAILFWCMIGLVGCALSGSSRATSLVSEDDFQFSVIEGEDGFLVELRNLSETPFCIYRDIWPPSGGYVGDTSDAPMMKIGEKEYDYGKRISSLGHTSRRLIISPDDSLKTTLFYSDFIDAPAMPGDRELVLKVYPRTC